MEVECGADCGESEPPRQTDLMRAILVMSASDQDRGYIEALATEFPDVMLIEIETIQQACRPYDNPVALILVDHDLMPVVEAMLNLIREFHPDAQIAAMYPTVAAARQSVASGRWSRVCRSLLPMDLPLEIWLAVVRLVLAGGEYLPVQPVDTAMLRHSDATQSDTERDGVSDDLQTKLTARELQILNKASQGMQNKLIAAEFGLSEHTVKVHLHNIIRKLGVHNRTEAAAKYHQLVDSVHKRNLSSSPFN